MTARLGLESSVTFAGRQEDVRPYLLAGDVLVLPSEREGLPLVLLEAMACGIPCIASDLEGNREVIVEGETGRLVATGSAAELAEAMFAWARIPPSGCEWRRTARGESRSSSTWKRAWRSSSKSSCRIFPGRHWRSVENGSAG